MARQVVINTDKELYEFANDVYDVLANNDNMCTQQAFLDKHAGDDMEIDCATNTISIGDFQIKISRKEQL